MERCSVPWTETPPPMLPTPPQHQTEEPQSESSPTSRRASPVSPNHTQDPIQLAYSSTIGSQVESGNSGMTVIRGLKSHSPLEEPNSPADEQLVYQTLGDSNNGLMVQYGFNYPGNFSPTAVPAGSPGHYDKLNYAKLGYPSDVHMGQVYETEASRSISPAGNLIYTYPYSSQEVTHPNSHPMWGALNSSTSNATYITGISSNILDPNDNGRYGTTYVGNSAFLLTPGNEPGWATLPSMSSPTYHTEGRRQYEPPPEYSRIVEPTQPQCAMCGITDTPSWKRDNTGQLVCSSCCIYKNGGAQRVSTIRPQRRLTTSRRIGMTCSNCNTTDTTLWRRNTQGEPVCNACGLYYKLHQVNRPISMRKDSIQTRKRKPKSSGSVVKGKSSNSSNGATGKSPGTSSAAAYLSQMSMPEGDLEGDPHRLSPLLPSSDTLSQQLPPFTPLDDSPLHTSSVISITPNHKHI